MTGILPNHRPYPAALDAIHRRVAGDHLVPAPTGHLIASTSALPDAPPGPLTRFGLAVVGPGPRAPAATPPAALDEFGRHLLDLHVEVLRQALRHAVRHLRERISGDTSLLGKQLIQGQLADIAMLLAEEEAMPPARRHGDPVARWRTYRRLVIVRPELMRLFGASGFLVGSPAGNLHLAEVTGNVYLHPGPRPERTAEGADV